MTTYRPTRVGNTNKPYVDPAPFPKDVPQVDELGVTSAPLKSGSFFIGSYCKPYTEDFMLCKAESQDPEHCLKEGRRVTRCAMDAISKIKATCLDEFTEHWKCLDFNNHGFEFCRKPEKTLNTCLFEKLQYRKEIPGSPEGQPQIHEKKNPIYGRIQR
ncbi:NADH dehydrogenase 1 alpha subcomplex 8 [Phakopsora pachyrhizi]|uniref:NADH-ubiquinone oxidoreductase n=1 Tax=Phakopsora pachyrhizi TaxID=170000 RepID=A0AAV0B448_PHAPC|nr:NADH dehydrogenase 1 alpha subcomplex 8 [Phakopsora pachyrhizi]CAH7666916.1 NADH dehydrogenase 1 alpha subcomplex 8 [Phakopsora pachyrhizi]CAH7676838.1 NADH dehydrogenase 1 alpha subcomplex 8 [Phakopsora pachyrhizi]